MYSFHYQYVLLVKLHEIAVEMALPFLEVKARNLNLLPVQKVIQLLAEKFQVHGLESLEIIIPVFVPRG